MEKVTYEIFAENLDVQNEKGKDTYGIRAVRGSECVASFSDLSTDADLLDSLAVLCTYLELDPVQLGDVVDDFLTDFAV